MNDGLTNGRPRASKRADRRKQAGREAEEAAAAYLADQGFVILERNWRCRTGEIDLIAKDGERLVFVEVRSRRESSRFGTAVEAVNARKCARVRAVAGVYLSMSRAGSKPIRFDVVAVTFAGDGGVGELRHIAGAF